MQMKLIAKTRYGQDGAIWEDYLFRLNAKGLCTVYDLGPIDTSAQEPVELPIICEFTLDKKEIIIPHSNAVVFGNEYFSPEDEFPLLYSNIYNNYSNSEDRLVGVCCVYRIQRNETEFSSTLVQIIQIGFTENSEYWCSSAENNDIRPFGNFVIDRENSIYYAYTMRDKCDRSRYFSFPLPKLSDGVLDKKYGVKKVILGTDDIIDYFDCEYHKFVQGGCFKDGRVYSVEGFTNSEERPPALRVINVNQKCQEFFIEFKELGSNIEPELIDFRNDDCYYSDGDGNLYLLTF